MSTSTQPIVQPELRSKKSKSKKKTTAPSEALQTSSIDVPEPASESFAPQATEIETAAPAEEVRVGSTKKGPVEEMISKRLRLLGKKIQRFKAYSASPTEKLNADQIAALASLPTLEGGWKELDDVMKFVEIIELEQASKVRETKAENEKNIDTLAQSKVLAFQTALSKPLSQFLRLHALLHPARPSDQTHLTFGPLTLPSSLQDEVQATDILRVGRMYEDLLTGDNAAQGVLDSLVNKPEDEEGARIHHLLELLDRPESATEEQIPEDESQDVEVQEDAREAGQAEILHPTSIDTSRAPSALGQNSLLNGHSELNFLSNEVGDETSSSTAVENVPTSEPTLNFLQDDELEKDLEDGYEVLEMPPAHETSGLQPPPEEESAVPAREGGSTPGVPPSAPAHFDWAADDELDDAVEAERLRSAFSTNGAVTPANPTQTSESSSADPTSSEAVGSSAPLAEPLPIESTHPAAPDTTSTPATTTTESAPTSAKSNPKPSGQSKQPQNQNQNQKKSQSQTQPGKKNEPITIIDEDGFEMKVRRQPLPQRGRGFGGRGGAGAGGAGRGTGRGRGGAQNGTRPPRPQSNGNPQSPNPVAQSSNQPTNPAGQGRARPPRAPQSAQTGTQSGVQNGGNAGKPKGSIFKAEQPKGPVSAPIF